MKKLSEKFCKFIRRVIYSPLLGQVGYKNGVRQLKFSKCLEPAMFPAKSENFCLFRILLTCLSNNNVSNYLRHLAIILTLTWPSNALSFRALLSLVKYYGSSSLQMMAFLKPKIRLGPMSSSHSSF